MHFHSLHHVNGLLVIILVIVVVLVGFEVVRRNRD